MQRILTLAAQCGDDSVQGDMPAAWPVLRAVLNTTPMEVAE